MSFRTTCRFLLKCHFPLWCAKLAHLKENDNTSGAANYFAPMSWQGKHIKTAISLHGQRVCPIGARCNIPPRYWRGDHSGFSSRFGHSGFLVVPILRSPCHSGCSGFPVIPGHLNITYFIGARSKNVYRRGDQRQQGIFWYLSNRP